MTRSVSWTRMLAGVTADTSVTSASDRLGGAGPISKRYRVFSALRGPQRCFQSGSWSWTWNSNPVSIWWLWIRFQKRVPFEGGNLLTYEIKKKGTERQKNYDCSMTYQWSIAIQHESYTCCNHSRFIKVYWHAFLFLSFLGPLNYRWISVWIDNYVPAASLFMILSYRDVSIIRLSVFVKMSW